MHIARLAFAAGFVFTASACTLITWDKQGATQAEFNQDNAKCRLLARGMNPGGFYAQGSPQFVAGAAVGNAIGTAMNQRETYRDCMNMQGYSERGASAAAASASSSDAPTPGAGYGGGGPGEPFKVMGSAP